MLKDDRQQLRTVVEGTLLATDGRQLGSDLWDEAVYLGKDGFVYHISADEKRGGVERNILAKRAVGEYLRWVDGLFRQGEVPSQSGGIHYRAARKLRELI
jgi:hypothetical protein